MAVSQQHIDKILKDPSAVYDTPHDVFSDAELTHDIKHQILLGWEKDVRALMQSGAGNEAGPGKMSPEDLLAEIKKLRNRLNELKKEG